MFNPQKKDSVMIGAIIVGLLAGLIASKLMHREGTGCVWNCILGIVGGFVGAWVFDLLKITWGGVVGQIGTGVIGAIIVLYVASLVMGKK